MTKNLLIGLEIESEINKDYSNLKISDIGDYHNGIKYNKYFKIERDGSIKNELYNNSFCVEFVSNTLKSRIEFFKAVENFKKIIINNNKNKELIDLINFNSSCGLHIHIGNVKKRYYKLIDYKIIEDLRKMFFKLIDESNILSDNSKESIKKHYFRYYAKKQTKIKYFARNGGKYREFNILSELNGYGLEWRSFNLRNIKKWSEYDELFKIAYKCIEFLHKKIENGYKIKSTPRLNKSLLLNDILQINRSIIISEIEINKPNSEIFNIN